jgi:hypothetical protein
MCRSPARKLSFQYAVVCTRLDVSKALSILGSAQASSTEAHLKALKEVLLYLSGTLDLRLTLWAGADHSLQLTSVADADWANNNNIGKSRSGYLFTLCRGHVNYKCKQQTCVAVSTCEAEHYTRADATKEGFHLR